MEYIVLIVAVIGCVFCPFWIKNARDTKDRGFGIFSMCGSIVMLVISIFLISYNNDILFFSQKQDAINATISIDETKVESSSILYLFTDNINSEITSDDIEELLGSNYMESSSTGSYSMRYATDLYTLNGVKSDYVFAYFNRSGPKGKVRSVSWQYENSDKQLYNELLTYLSTILGQPEKQDVSSMGTLTADWPGFHLECNDYRVSFGRVFN